MQTRPPATLAATRAAVSLAVAVALLGLSAEPAAARATTGIGSPETAGATTCTGLVCHAIASESVEVTIDGPAMLAPGERARYTVSIAELQVGAGLNVALENGGFLSLVDENTMFFKTTGEITHVSGANVRPDLVNEPGSVGDWSYDFDLTAPQDAETGETLILNAAMNAFNQNGLPSGDFWNAARLEIEITGAGPDEDADGVPNDADNCVVVPNGPDLGTCVGSDDTVGTLCDSDEPCAPGACSLDQEDADADGNGDVCECGDATSDGLVNTSDARRIQRCVVGLLPCVGLCDTTDDAECTTSDARRIQRFAVGAIGKSDLTCAQRPAP